MKNRLSFALLAASALALAGCSSINTARNTSKQPSMEKLTPPSGQAFLTLEGSGIQIFRCATDAKGTYWRFGQPQAKLKDKSGEAVAELSGPMSSIKAFAMVTVRYQPLEINGKKTHTIGLIHHWSWASAYATGDTMNDLSPNVGDPNSYIPEYKAFLVNVEKAK